MSEENNNANEDSMSEENNDENNENENPASEENNDENEEGENPALEEINIEKENPPISSGFKLEGLKKLNVIVGENNTGKTRFFSSIDKQHENDDNVRVVYIRANEVNPEDDYYKSSSAATSLVKMLSALFGDTLRLYGSKKVEEGVKGFVQEIEEKFGKMCGENDGNDCGLKVITERGLNKEEAIKSMIKSITTSWQDGEGNPIKLSDIGQGYQRMFIASLLQVYADKQVKANQNILILFEEPELFLHPKLKRSVNASLKRIASLPNHQVIISTHDPYFLWSNMDDEDTALYSFVIGGDGKTALGTGGVGFGVEDEMLHISLFSKMAKEMKVRKMQCTLGGNMRITSDSLVDFSKKYDKKYKFRTKTYTFKGQDYEVILPIYIRNKIHHPENDDNQYTQDELAQSIKDLNHLLGLLYDMPAE